MKINTGRVGEIEGGKNKKQTDSERRIKRERETEK